MSFAAHFQALISDNFGILALFQVLIADSFDILALFQVLIAETFGILAHFQALIAENFGIFNTLGKNKHHPGLKPMTSGITSHYSANCATNSLKLFYILYIKKHNTQYRRRVTGEVRQET